MKIKAIRVMKIISPVDSRESIYVGLYRCDNVYLWRWVGYLGDIVEEIGAHDTVRQAVDDFNKTFKSFIVK